MSEEIEINLRIDEEDADKIYYGGGQSLKTSLIMMLEDYRYFREKISQWQEKGTEPTHQEVVDGLDTSEAFANFNYKE